MDAEECALTYEVERKPLKAKTEAPKGTLRFGGFYANSAGWSGMGSLSGDDIFSANLLVCIKFGQTLAFLGIKGNFLVFEVIFSIRDNFGLRI